MIPQLAAQDLTEFLREKSVDVLKLRPVSEFLFGFVPGSINLPHPRDVVFISGDSAVPDDVVSAVKEAGGTLTGYVSYENWAEAGYTILTLESVRIEDVLDNRRQFELMDVRTEEEWRQKRIHGALNLPLANLRVKAYEMDMAKKYVAFCVGVSAWTQHAGTMETGSHS